jgi:hypothetical protein
MAFRFVGWLLTLGIVFAAPAGALAATPKTEAQSDALALKASMTKSFKTSAQLRGVNIGNVLCVLPANGSTFHCTVHTSAAAAHEDIVFKVAATLHDNDATSVTWKVTSSSCTDSGTHARISC